MLSKSKTFNFEMNCEDTIEYENKNVCQFVKSYAEGSSLFGVMGFDYIRFKNSHNDSFPRLKELNTYKKDLQIKAEFGCTTKETGLFRT